jgi:SAM-dependent methyltransferase
MSSYLGRHAELYDLFYAAKPYVAEAAFVHQCLQQYSAPAPRRVLELACGTGAHAFALEKFGYQIIAIDYSEDMLAVARRKAATLSSQVDFRWQDMRALDLSERPFDAVICLFDAIGYVATNDALRQVLQGVHRHLRAGGLFVFEFWHAGAMLNHYDPVRVRRWKTLQGEVLRISETALDVAQQLASVTYSVYELRADATFSSFAETQTNRYFLVQEMTALLTVNGFTPLKYFAGFTADENITNETWHIVAVARCAE